MFVYVCVRVCPPASQPVILGVCVPVGVKSITISKEVFVKATLSNDSYRIHICVGECNTVDCGPLVVSPPRHECNVNTIVM